MNTAIGSVRVPRWVAVTPTPTLAGLASFALTLVSASGCGEGCTEQEARLFNFANACCDQFSMVASEDFPSSPCEDAPLTSCGEFADNLRTGYAQICRFMRQAGVECPSYEDVLDSIGDSIPDPTVCAPIMLGGLTSINP